MSKLEYYRKILRAMSKEALSKKSGLPVSRITRLENDLEETTLSDWSALAKALKVPAKELYVNQPGNGLVPRERSSDFPCIC